MIGESTTSELSASSDAPLWDGVQNGRTCLVGLTFIQAHIFGCFTISFSITSTKAQWSVQMHGRSMPYRFTLGPSAAAKICLSLAWFTTAFVASMMHLITALSCIAINMVMIAMNIMPICYKYATMPTILLMITEPIIFKPIFLITPQMLMFLSLPAHLPPMILPFSTPDLTSDGLKCLKHCHALQ